MPSFGHRVAPSTRSVGQLASSLTSPRQPNEPHLPLLVLLGRESVTRRVPAAL